MGREIWEYMKLATQAGKGPHPIVMGYVNTYDPNTNTVKVYFAHDTSVARGPYPLLMPWVGSGWGMQAAPLGGTTDSAGNPVGEPCLILFPDEEGTVGFVLLGAFNQAFQPPKVPGGECWLIHKDGAKLKLKASGKAEILGTTVELGSEGCSGTPGNAVARLSDLQALANVFNAHIHPAPFGPTSAPTTTQSPTASSVSFTS